jgi:hypothetical protein
MVSPGWRQLRTPGSPLKSLLRVRAGRNKTYVLTTPLTGLSVPHDLVDSDSEI